MILQKRSTLDKLLPYSDLTEYFLEHITFLIRREDAGLVSNIKESLTKIEEVQQDFIHVWSLKEEFDSKKC